MRGMDLRLPSITGRTDGERVAELTRYLYRLVEELNWYLRDGEDVTASEGATTARGQSYGWTWELAPSGDFRAFGRFSLTPAGSEAVGAMFLTAPLTVPLPFPVREAHAAGAAGGAYAVADVGLSGDRMLTLRLLGAEAPAVGASVGVDLLVMGTAARGAGIT